MNATIQKLCEYLSPSQLAILAAMLDHNAQEDGSVACSRLADTVHEALRENCGPEHAAMYVERAKSCPDIF